MNALRLAISWLTVAPIAGPSVVDRAASARAIALAPVVGAVLGAVATAVLWLLDCAGASSSVAGLAAVAVLALLTRGMHVDGLADTFDGLGTYGPPDRAREVMKSGGAGPFGVAAIVFAIGVQAMSFAALVDTQRWFAVALAVTLGRVAVVLACHRGGTAAPDTWFGAQVAGTQSPITITLWLVATLVAGGFAVQDHRWLGPLTVVLVLAATMLLIRHSMRRIGGLSGDLLGAAAELAVALAALGFALGG